jgi:hypothetical protein
VTVAPIAVDGDDAAWDASDARVVAAPPEALLTWNLAGIIGPAEVHGARTLAALVGDDRSEVLLAAALALRAPLHGHVCVELGTVAETITVAEDAPVDPGDLDWPEPETWRKVLVDSPLVRERPASAPVIATSTPILPMPSAAALCT